MPSPGSGRGLCPPSRTGLSPARAAPSTGTQASLTLTSAPCVHEWFRRGPTREESAPGGAGPHGHVPTDQRGRQAGHQRDSPCRGVTRPSTTSASNSNEVRLTQAAPGHGPGPCLHHAQEEGVLPGTPKAPSSGSHWGPQAETAATVGSCSLWSQGLGAAPRLECSWWHIHQLSPLIGALGSGQCRRPPPTPAAPEDQEHQCPEVPRPRRAAQPRLLQACVRACVRVFSRAPS